MSPLLLPIALLIAIPLSAAESPAGPQGQPVEILAYDLAANQDKPELCFLLSETVARRPASPLESFVSADPSTTLTATPRNDRLCLTGLAFGGAYTITLKAGLPGVGGVLVRDSQFRIQVPNRPPELSFPAADQDVLPRMGSAAVPIRSVNVPKIDVDISRIGDDDLLEHREAGMTGSPIWRGTVEPKGDANLESVTELPLDQTVGQLKPGLYTASIWPSGSPSAGQIPPSLRFAVSDLGLTAYRGPASLLVAARSLSTAAAAPGIDVALVARNNRELGRVRTDGNGFARFDPAVLRASDGGSPTAIRAYGPAGEFATLDLGDAPAAPQGGTIAIHLARDSYRPGETVTLLALQKSPGSGTKPPLTLTVLRPNGAALFSQQLNDQGDGAYSLVFNIPDKGSIGRWRVEARPDASGPAVATAAFTVDPPAASRLNIALNADVAVIDPAQPANVVVQTATGDTPAGGTPGELRVTVEAAAVPFPAFPGFSFGSADEPAVKTTADPVRFTTDAGGKASLPVKVPLPRRVSGPLEATVVARMFDAAGRTVERTIAVPVAGQALLFGIKPTPGPTFPAGQNAHFEVIAVSPDGARQEKKAAGWEILRRDWKPSWDWNGTRFAYRPAVKDTHVAGGTVDIPANAPAAIDSALPQGRYRIEVFDPNGEAISSARFMVGWAEKVDGDPPDMVQITPAKPFYAPGDDAEIFVKPPYDADVTLVPADPDIRDATVQHIPAAGATLHLTIPRDAGAALRLMATAVAPPNTDAPDLTRRAFGAVTYRSDPAPRTLDVKLDPPQVAAPQQTLAIPITVSGAGDEAVHVRVALLDQRGDAASREPAKTDTPVAAETVTDNYGRLITPSGVSSGVFQDAAQPAEDVQPAASAPTSAGPAMSVYSAIAALDKSGKGTVSVPVPDFTGNARIRVLAWSASRTGRGEADIAIGYPLHIALPLPAFLMPDDRADETLALDNAGGPRGEYRIAVRAEGAVSVQNDAETIVNLAEHEQRSLPVAVQAHGAGSGAVVVSVKGPGGIAFERRLPLTVRTSAPPVLRNASVTLKPGAALAPDPSLTAELRPETLGLSITASAGNNLNMPGIAQALPREAEETSEQVVDRTAPLFVAETKSPPATDPPSEATPLQRAVERLAGYQNGDGGFSAWSGGQSDLWLTAYAGEFLGRAKARGAVVSDAVLRQTLDYLAIETRRQSETGSPDPDTQPPALAPPALASIAYADKVLAAAGRMDLFQLRFFNDRFQPQIHNPATAGLVAAAFAALGDKASAAASFARAATLPVDPSAVTPSGSDLRDQAVLVALMAESGAAAQPSVASALAKLYASAAGRRQFSASEAAWLIRAAATQTPAAVPFKLKIGDKTVDQNTPFAFASTGAPPPQIKNVGDSPVHLAISVSGMPAQGDVKEQQGYEIQRWFFDTNGKQVDPALLRQGDELVVVLTGRYTGPGDAHPMVIDPLAAGWEAEAAEIADIGNRYPWLKDVTGAVHAGTSDGAYIAVPRLAGDKHEFKLAYVIRAAVRGQFALPGTLVQDTVQPALSARTPAGRTKVDPAS